MPSLFSTPVFFCLRAFLFLLRPVVRIRIGLIPYRSLGRIAGNMEYYLRKKARGGPGPGQVDVLVSGTRPVNRQIMKMVKRRVPVLESDWLWGWLGDMQGDPPAQPGRQGRPPDIPMWLNLRNAGYLVEWETWQQVEPQLDFTEEEHVLGRELLRTLGIPEGAEYVTMHARDKAYTDSPDTVRSPDDPFSYDDFRDCDIATYLPAAEWLTEQGIWVVRVGHRVEGPLPGNHSMIIDYAARFRGQLEDPEFADVYLQARCKFFVGCTAGICYLSHIFNVPIAWVNMIPLAECGRLDHDLFILKKYRHSREERFLTFPEMVDRGADWSRLWHDKLQAYKEEGIEFVDSTAEEILDLVKEMHARLEGSWTSQPEDAGLQDKFRQIFPPGHPMTEFPGYLGAAYARNNRELLG